MTAVAPSPGIGSLREGIGTVVLGPGSLEPKESRERVRCAHCRVGRALVQRLHVLVQHALRHIRRLLGGGQRVVEALWACKAQDRRDRAREGDGERRGGFGDRNRDGGDRNRDGGARKW